MRNASRLIVTSAALILMAAAGLAATGHGASASADATQGPLPTFLPLASGVNVQEVVADEAYGEAEFRAPGKDSNIQRGHHWKASLTVVGVSDETPGKALWARMKPAFAAAGWTVVGEYDENPYSVTAKTIQGRQAWVTMLLISREDIRLDLVEIAASKRSLVLAPPAARPESISVESGDFPYLMPLAGAVWTSSGRSETAFEVTLPGQQESAIVAPAAITKHYNVPPSISTVECAEVYRTALKTAGWSIVMDSQGLNASDAELQAHYTKNGRDIWAMVHYGPGELSLTVADAGGQDWGDALRKTCRATLTGVFFDFDKATLKTESDGALGRAAAALAANAGLAVEVQGHTDNVGADAYNVTLSEARAKAVLGWLTAHGIPAAQLSAKGYGKSVPVASNDTDAGRAQNRRVELACRK